MEAMNDVLKKLTDFATKHDLRLETCGEVGFGRSCVGFQDKLRGNYVDYNPGKIVGNEYQYIWTYDLRLDEAATENSYHKHRCMAVLVHGDYESALRELAFWVDCLESQGEVYIEKFDTGSRGLQAIFSGEAGMALRIRNEKSKKRNKKKILK